MCYVCVGVGLTESAVAGLGAVAEPGGAFSAGNTRHNTGLGDVSQGGLQQLQGVWTSRQISTQQLGRF